MENWTNVKKLISYSKGGITSKELTRGAKGDATLFCMARGTSLSEHTSTWEGLVYVLEGSGEFNLEGERIRMVPGTFIRMRKRAVHSLAAKKDTSFILILHD